MFTDAGLKLLKATGAVRVRRDLCRPGGGGPCPDLDEDMGARQEDALVVRVSKWAQRACVDETCFSPVLERMEEQTSKYLQ